jgi:hypothetical protein
MVDRHALGGGLRGQHAGGKVEHIVVGSSVLPVKKGSVVE